MKPDNKHVRNTMSRIATYDPKVHKLGNSKRKTLTSRETKFVEIWLTAAGAITMKEAAIQAGYPVGAASSTANKLTNPKVSPHVVEYIQKRQRELAAKYGTTFERHMQDLLMIRDKAIEAGAWAAAVQAEYRRGQALGTIYIDRKEIRHGTIDSMSKEEVQRKLEELRRLYNPPREVVDVEDTKLKNAIEMENSIDKSDEGELSGSEAGDEVLSEDEGGDDEGEDYPR